MRKASSRLVAVIAGVAAVAVVAIGGAWLMHERMKPTPPARPGGRSTSGNASDACRRRRCRGARPCACGHFRIDRGSATAPGPTVMGATDLRRRRVPFVPAFSPSRRSRITPRPKAPRRWRSMCAASSRSRRAASTIRRPARLALEDCNRDGASRGADRPREFDHCMTYAVGNKVVWSYPRAAACRQRLTCRRRRPSPPITFDPAAVPLLIGENARQNLADHYMKIRPASARWCSGATISTGGRRARPKPTPSGATCRSAANHGPPLRRLFGRGPGRGAHAAAPSRPSTSSRRRR